MSWEIVYSKQFIKTNKGIIPLLLAGSNNCWEYTCTGKQRRERNWTRFFNGFQDKVIYTEEEINNYIDEICKNATYEEWFKTSYSGKFLNNLDLKRFYKNAIRQSKTIEEIAENSNIKDLRCHIYNFGENYNHSTLIEESINNTQDLEDWINRALKKKEELKEANKKNNPFIVVKFKDNEPIRLKKVIKENRFKDDEEVVLKYKRRYITDITEYGISTTKELNNDVWIETYKDALELVNNSKYYKNDIVIVKYQKPKEKNFIIKFKNNDNEDGGYFINSYKYGIRYTWWIDQQVKRFESKEQANKYIENNLKIKLGDKYSFEIINLLEM